MFEIVRILLLTTHLLCVNVAAGGPILCIWLEWTKKPVGRDAIRYLAAASLAGLLLGGLLGLCLGLLEWDGDYQSVWTVQLGRKVFWGVLEFVFSATLLGGYWWRPKPHQPTAWSSGLRTLLLLFASTNLLYHFPPLFFNGQRLLDRHGEAAPLSSSEFRRMMFSGETLPLTVHFAVASIAVAGLALAHIALRWRRQGRSDDAHWAAVEGGRWSLGATLLQLPVGLWTLVALPSSMQNQLVGGDASGSVLFASALAAALWLTRELVNLALGESERNVLSRAMLAMLLTVTLMTAAHEIARSKRKTPTNMPRANNTALEPNPS